MYPQFFDKSLMFIPVAWERIRITTPNRSFRVLYVFGIRLFVAYVHV